MRKKTLAALAAALMLLSACGRQGGEEALAALRQRLGAASGIRIAADVTADAGEDVWEFSLVLTADADGCTVEVTAPAEIAGVRAHTDAEGTSIEYDGLMLAVPELAESGLTPVTALPMLLAALKDGFAEGAWSEGGGYAVSLVTDGGTTATVLLTEDGSPEYAEFISSADGRVLAACEITEFTLS